MEAKDTVIIEKICLGICTGYSGRCQRYPDISTSCEDFIKYLDGYKAGIREVVELISKLIKAAKAGECPDPGCPICKEKWKTIEEGQAKLKEWEVDND